MSYFHSESDTIYAMATPLATSAIAILRLSGKNVKQALSALRVENLAPRQAKLAKLYHPRNEIMLDEALVLWFPAPHSFTGEDCAELHLHGGLAVIKSVLAALAEIPGLRPAEPGEFSRRAFAHDKMDLAEAEALIDLIEAKTEAQRRLALRQYQGDLSALYGRWREAILHNLAYLEAFIDFPDEEIPEHVLAEIDESLKSMRQEMNHHLAEGEKGERLARGVEIAIIGAPNAGKSSLLNTMASKEAAIVSDIPGTTRDVIETVLDIDGFPVILADTAGLRASRDPIEQEGIRRAQKRAADADLVLVLWDPDQGPLDDLFKSYLHDRALLLITKGDLRKAGALPADPSLPEAFPKTAIFPISTQSGAGMPAFWQALRGRLADLLPSADSLVFTKARHRFALEQALAGFDGYESEIDLALRAENLRQSLRAIGAITGHANVEEILDAVFKRFCIGK